MSSPARRELVRHMIGCGLSERRSLRYEPVSDRNCALKEKTIALVQRHRRYGASMIYLKLRQAGEIVNHKRVDRLYARVVVEAWRREYNEELLVLESAK